MSKLLQWIIYTLFLSIPGIVLMKRYIRTYQIVEPQKKIALLLLYITSLVGVASLLPVNRDVFHAIVIFGMVPLVFVKYLFSKSNRVSPEAAQKELDKLMKEDYRLWLRIFLMLLLILYLVVNWNQGWQWPLVFLVLLLGSTIHYYITRKRKW